MIYFDNAATTLQKPPQVARAMEAALISCANPGRSGHRPAMKAADAVYRCREEAAEFFGAPGPESIVFTQNATHALNIAVKSVLHDGGHAVISGYEHNSVVRPLEAMKAQGVTYTAAQSPLFSQHAAYGAICEALREDTRCIVVNHISNVFGFVLPLEAIDRLCLRKGIPLIVDASQSAGILPVRADKLKSARFICMPGHKSLYGPQGTGILISCADSGLHSLMQGGTGSNSIETEQPDFLPDIFESGTLNVPGIAGLHEGLRFVRRQGLAAMAQHKRRLVEAAADGLSSLDGVTVYHAGADCHQGLLAFTVRGMSSAEACQRLAERGICLRDGLHCSPLAHRSAGTLPDGACRVSFSYFNTLSEVKNFLSAVKKMLTSP